MKPPDNDDEPFDPFNDWADKSRNMGDFKSGKDPGEEGQRITIDQSIQIYMNAIAVMNEEQLVAIAPFIIETDMEKYDEQMFWIATIAGTLVMKMVEFGIPIYPKNVNNSFSYATLIYMMALSGGLDADTLDDTEEDIT
jgi:hypothetical protein